MTLNFPTVRMFGLDNRSIYAEKKHHCEDFYKPVLVWLKYNNIDCELKIFDNAAYSDYNEDPWRGYWITFKDEQQFLLFKLTWEGRIKT
jgi:hypothetical protein